MIIVLNTFFVSYLVRFNFTLDFDKSYIKYQIPFIAVVSLISFLLIGSYKGIVRHTGIKDAYNVFYASIVISLILSIFFYLNLNFNLFKVTIPRSIIAIHFMLNVIFLIGSRFIFKQIYHRLAQNIKHKSRVLIYGAGASGLITYMALSEDVNKIYDVRGFVDDNKDLIGKRLKGLPIYSGKRVNEQFLEDMRVDEVIISIQSISNTALLEIIDRLLTFSVKVKAVPPVRDWIDGTLKTQQIKEVKLEDLLQRKPIEIFNETIEHSLHEKTVMVTGAAGSIGREISLQLAEYSCNQLIFIDQGESPLYELQMDLIAKGKSNIHYYVADVRDFKRMQHIFESYKIDYIFHAAAYKHVPLMEENPYEAVRVNIMGSKNMMDLAVAFGVEKFVMVSTDKAVNPTNVMGASKRIAELYALAKNAEGKTKFITTRFGNVLGSNGSVIPLFKKQIEHKGPLTVTHPEIIRFFMTIPEACQLVLEAGIMGKGGEIFVFDMGQSVKIFDVAKNMIRLAGYKYPEEIDIVFTGLRPGEKLFEEVLSNSETTIPTHHSKILIAKSENIVPKDIILKIQELSELDCLDHMKLVQKIKDIVPEYISANSVFNTLDVKKTKVYN
ncbi:MAG: polysaccharide biosynthesis protein [Flavobacteriaceae bacterium]|nr:polysaccharide biosynthesis protein [Flavobacteriaceae bacterium]